MENFLKKLILTHKKFWNKKHINSIINGSFLLIIALVIQKIADYYVVSTKGTVVGDIILNNIPTLDIDGFIIISVLLFNLIMIILLIFKPKYLAFVLKSLALFVVIRSFFISLTHLGIQPSQITFNPNAFGYSIYNFLYNSTNDFFFSGHTGLPFLMALVFFKEVFYRNLFFITSFIFAISVIIGHIHYSIDVFAAPFITYGIYNIAKKIFNYDYKIILIN